MKYNPSIDTESINYVAGRRENFVRNRTCAHTHRYALDGQGRKRKRKRDGERKGERGVLSLARAHARSIAPAGGHFVLTRSTRGTCSRRKYWPTISRDSVLVARRSRDEDAAGAMGPITGNADGRRRDARPPRRIARTGHRCVPRGRGTIRSTPDDSLPSSPSSPARAAPGTAG